MDDELLPEMNDEEFADMLMDQDMNLLEIDRGVSAVERGFDEFMSVCSVDSVYGSPIEQGDTLLIPAAEVLSAAGFGVGSGHGESPTKEGESNYGGGGGGGGGGWNSARPVAVIVASPEGVYVQPVVDITKVAIAALTTAGLMFSLMIRMMRPTRR
jgi:uncharacterized spore protein YtfJ